MIFEVTIYNSMTKKNRRLKIEAFGIGDVYECVQSCRKIYNPIEEIIKIERYGELILKSKNNFDEGFIICESEKESKKNKRIY